MIYVYDIMLNFTKENIYDFYEWEKDDKYTHVKKIPLLRVNDTVFKQFYYGKIKVEKEFLNKIKGLTEKYKKDKIMYACIFSNSLKGLAVWFDQNGVVLFKSTMLLDEEEEVVNLSLKLEETNISYSLLSNNELEIPIDFETRYEKKVRNFLKKELEMAYLRKDVKKLEYMALEILGDVSSGLDIYEALCQSLDSLHKGHQTVYEIFKLCHSRF